VKSSFFFPKQIDKDLKKHTFSFQMCFVSSDSVISAKKLTLLQSQKLIFFGKKNTASVSPTPGNWDTEVTMQNQIVHQGSGFFTIF